MSDESYAAASMVSVRQVEQQEAMVDQRIEQLTREGEQLEEELRRMGVNCVVSGGWVGGEVRLGLILPTVA